MRIPMPQTRNKKGRKISEFPVLEKLSRILKWSLYFKGKINFSKNSVFLSD